MCCACPIIWLYYVRGFQSSLSTVVIVIGRCCWFLVGGHLKSVCFHSSFLSCLGYQVRYWGLGTNWGQPEVDTYILRDNLLREFEKNRQNFPLDVIGWSLGGVVARELARMEPKLVRSVITLGTPVIGGPTYTVGAPHWGREECLRITKMLEEMDAENPIQTPVTSIFTRRDQAVHWAASIDRFSKSAKHIEVDSTHMKLGIDELVFRLLVLELCDQTNCSDIPEVAMETV